MDPVTKNLRALQGALEHSLTIQRTRLQEIVDDLVSRGSLSRTDADGLLSQLLTSSKDYSQALLQVLESVTADARKTIERRHRAGDGDGRQARRTRPQGYPVSPKKPSAQRSEGGAQAGMPSRSPATSGAQRSPDQAAARRLEPPALRRVRENELAGKARKTVIAQIDAAAGAKS